MNSPMKTSEHITKLRGLWASVFFLDPPPLGWSIFALALIYAQPVEKLATQASEISALCIHCTLFITAFTVHSRVEANHEAMFGRMRDESKKLAS